MLVDWIIIKVLSIWIEFYWNRRFINCVHVVQKWPISWFLSWSFRQFQQTENKLCSFEFGALYESCLLMEYYHRKFYVNQIPSILELDLIIFYFEMLLNRILHQVHFSMRQFLRWLLFHKTWVKGHLLSSFLLSEPYISSWWCISYGQENYLVDINRSYRLFSQSLFSSQCFAFGNKSTNELLITIKASFEIAPPSRVKKWWKWNSCFRSILRT